jgi:hypothetical protein
MPAQQPIPPYETGPRRPSRWRRWLIALAVLMLLCVGGVAGGHYYVVARGKRQLAADEAGWDAQAKIGSWPDAKRVLDGQAAALLRHDRQGWLAAVDPGQPALRAEYTRLYDSLLALDVSGWSYNSFGPEVTSYGRSELTAHVTIAFCLQTTSCPVFDVSVHSGPDKTPTIQEELSMARRDGAYVITGRKLKADSVADQPTPWEMDELVFARGPRVTVAAPRALRDKLPEVLAAAERAAKTTDRYARYLGNPQSRYRVFMAGKKEWSTWFGGPNLRNVIGYASPSGLVGTDVVLRMDEIDDDYLFTVVRHEMGHVVTVGNVDRRADSILNLDQWVVEGIAEYIAYSSQPVTANPRISLLREGGLPRTMQQAPLPEDASILASNRFYGLGHFAMSCFADHFGERKLFTFVDALLRREAGPDLASRAAFGRSFGDVDRMCVADLRHLVG